MKNLLIIALLFAACVNTQAQTEQGSWALGLHNFSPIFSAGQLASPTNAIGISFGKNKYENNGQTAGESKYASVGLSGSAHYFLINDLSAGVNLNLFFQNEKEEGNDPDKYSTTIILAGPELRYYINAGAKSKVFIKGNAGFGSAASKFNGQKEGDTKLSQFGGGAGLAIFLGEQVALDLGLGYNIFKAKDSDDDTSTNSGASFDVGFTVFL